MSVDLTRARIVEFDTLNEDGTIRLLVSRRQSIYAFKVLGVNGDPSEGDWDKWTTKHIENGGTNITILAEFPLTLADLIPTDCTEFRFITSDGQRRTAVLDETDGTWEVTGIGYTFANLDSLQHRTNVDLNRVIPQVTTVHPQYVEERR